MCLIVSAKAKIRRANKERVCYKVLRKDGEQLRAPYMGTTYKVGNVVCSHKPLRLYHDVYHKTFSDDRQISKSGLHTFVNFEDALYLMSSLDFYYCQNSLYVIAECKIPVGANYVIGRETKGTQCYVSDKLIVERII